MSRAPVGLEGCGLGCGLQGALPGAEFESGACPWAGEASSEGDPDQIRRPAPQATQSHQPHPPLLPASPADRTTYLIK